MQGPKWPVILLTCGLGEVILIVGTGYVPWVGFPVQRRLCSIFEWCRVTRHSRVFRGLTGCQRTPGFWGVTMTMKNNVDL